MKLVNSFVAIIRSTIVEPYLTCLFYELKFDGIISNLTNDAKLRMTRFRDKLYLVALVY